MEMIEVLFLDDALEFLLSLPEQARKKVESVLFRVQAGVKSSSIFKKLEGSDIWEFRCEVNGIDYRILAFGDNKKGRLIVATHGFIKKTQKTPSKEIAKAERLMKEYFNTK